MTKRADKYNININVENYIAVNHQSEGTKTQKEVREQETSEISQLSETEDERQTYIAARVPSSAETTHKKKAKSLRIIAPDVYHYIIDELHARHNIHSYDVQLTGYQNDMELAIFIRFGEQYAHEREILFTHKMIQERHQDLQTFIQKTADECKETMVQEYFKMMKP